MGVHERVPAVSARTIGAVVVAALLPVLAALLLAFGPALAPVPVGPVVTPTTYGPPR